jgi:hypothetical protein
MLRICLSFWVVAVYGTTALCDERPPGREGSIQAFESFKRALSSRFNLPPQDESLPTTGIPSSECEIQIQNASQYGDRIMIEISRDESVWVMSVAKGEPAIFTEREDGFSLKTYLQDCEEMGCDGNWYVNRALFIGSAFLKAHQKEPSSREPSTFACPL